MNERRRVPIRVKRSPDGAKQKTKEQTEPVVESEPVVREQEPVVQEPATDIAPPQSKAEEVTAPTPPEDREEIERLSEELETWRDRALRLQAEIENFRRRQQRLAQEQIKTNQARLLRNFLMIADNLDRALRAEGNSDSLRDGVMVTYRSLNQLLRQEGVEQMEAEGETFDPEWHEAVGTVPHQEVDVKRGTVVEVAQQGYRLDDRLLRPARVIVAR